MFSGIQENGLSHDHAALVGKIAMEWSIVEASLQRITAVLIGKDFALGLSVTTHMGNRSLTDCLRTLAGATSPSSPDFWPETLALLDEYDRLLDLRNRVVHANWEPPKSATVWPVSVLRFKGKLRNQAELWRAGDLEKILEECGELTAAFYELAVKYEILKDMHEYGAQQASKGIQREQLPPVIPPRRPKSEAVMRQLLASRP